MKRDQIKVSDFGEQNASPKDIQESLVLGVNICNFLQNQNERHERFTRDMNRRLEKAFKGLKANEKPKAPDVNKMLWYLSYVEKILIINIQEANDHIELLNNVANFALLGCLEFLSVDRDLTKLGVYQRKGDNTRVKARSEKNELARFRKKWSGYLEILKEGIDKAKVNQASLPKVQGANIYG